MLTLFHVYYSYEVKSKKRSADKAENEMKKLAYKLKKETKVGIQICSLTYLVEYSFVLSFCLFETNQSYLEFKTMPRKNLMVPFVIDSFLSKLVLFK